MAFAFGEDVAETTDVAEFLLDHDLAWSFTVDNVTSIRRPVESERYEKVATIDL